MTARALPHEPKEWRAARDADELRARLAEALAGSAVQAFVEVRPVTMSAPGAPAAFYSLRLRWEIAMGGLPLLVRPLQQPGLAPVPTGDAAFDRAQPLVAAPVTVFRRLLAGSARAALLAAGLHDLTIERGVVSAWSVVAADRPPGRDALRAARDALAGLAEAMRELEREVERGHQGGDAYRPALDAAAFAAQRSAWQREVDVLAAALVRRPREQIVGFLAALLLGAGYAFAHWLGLA